jgi:hypothetical protein
MFYAASRKFERAWLPRYTIAGRARSFSKREFPRWGNASGAAENMTRHTLRVLYIWLINNKPTAYAMGLLLGTYL